MIRVHLRDFFSSGPIVAAGATMGIDHFKRIRSLLPQPQSAGIRAETLIALDFEGIEDATPSYIKATVLALHLCGRRFANALTASELLEFGENINPLNAITVIVNASDAVQVCIHEVMTARSLAVLAGLRWGEGAFDEAVVLGTLEPAIWEALTESCRFTEFQATDLSRSTEAVAISITGWNNRLAELYRQRLLRRRTVGRTHRFSPLAKEVSLYGQVLSRE